MLKWKNIKELLIFVPAVHLFLCFTYLFFYELRFSGGIHNFASPTDAFSISLSTLAPSYIVILIFLPWFAFNDKVGERLRGSDVANSILKRPWYVITPFVIIGTALILFVTGFMLWSMYGIIQSTRQFGFIPIAGVEIVGGGILATLSTMWARSISRDKTTRVSSVAFSLTLFSLIMTGLGDAQRDRYAEFNSLKKHNASCGDFVVVKPLSDKFLAVTSDESRIVINDDCEAVFTLHKSGEFVRLPDALIYRLWEPD